MQKWLVCLVFLLLGQLPSPGFAQASASDLSRALGVGEMIDIMHEEGLVHASELRAEMLPGLTGDAYRTRVFAIYDKGRMRTEFEREFAAAMDGVALAPLLTFFESDLGRRIVQLELSARRALMDESVEEASREAFSRAEAAGDARLDLIARYVAVNTLVDSNVEGALNSSYAFYKGLQAGDAFDGALTEERILADVWARQDEIRADTRDWVFSYLLLAYGPLSDDDLNAYIALSESEVGQALNAALFQAFDALFVRISRAQGETVAFFMAGEDI